MLVRKLGGDGEHLAAPRLHREPRLQARDGGESRVVVALLISRLIGRQADRLPHLRPGSWQLHPIRQHADDRIGASVELNRFANRRIATAEAAMPEALADEHSAFGARLIIAGHEKASAQRPNLKGSEQVVRRHGARDALGPAHAREVE